MKEESRRLFNKEKTLRSKMLSLGSGVQTFRDQKHAAALWFAGR